MNQPADSSNWSEFFMCLDFIVRTKKKFITPVRGEHFDFLRLFTVAIEEKLFSSFLSGFLASFSGRMLEVAAAVFNSDARMHAQGILRITTTTIVSLLWNYSIKHAV
jgi:hypothetical protein